MRFNFYMIQNTVKKTVSGCVLAFPPKEMCFRYKVDVNHTIDYLRACPCRQIYCQKMEIKGNNLENTLISMKW